MQRDQQCRSYRSRATRSLWKPLVILIPLAIFAGDFTRDAFPGWLVMPVLVTLDGSFFWLFYLLWGCLLGHPAWWVVMSDRWIENAKQREYCNRLTNLSHRGITRTL